MGVLIWWTSYFVFKIGRLNSSTIFFSKKPMMTTTQRWWADSMILIPIPRNLIESFLRILCLEPEKTFMMTRKKTRNKIQLDSNPVTTLKIQLMSGSSHIRSVSNLRWMSKLSSNFCCLFTFCYLDGANSIKTDLHICNPWTSQFVSYKSVI